MTQTYGYIPETPTITFPDWVGVPGSPYASDQALRTLEDASASISSFEREIDDAFDLDFDGINQLRFAYEPGTTFDWQSEFNDALPFAPALDSLTDDVPSSTYTLNEPLSPISEGTLVNSPTTAMLPELKLPPAEGALVDHQLASFPSLYPDAGFTFQCQPSSTTPPLDMYPIMVQANYDHQNSGQYWPEQLPSQHEVGAARVVVAGLATGVGMSTDSFALTSMDPTSPLPSPSAELQQDALVVSEEQTSISTTRTKRYRNSSNDISAGDKDDAPRKKRERPQQDTTKRFRCTEPGCPRTFARTYNLNVHISSVHLQERKHACKAPGCKRAFSRNHDLNRHYQSKHTNLGSPRKKSKEDGKAVTGLKSIKKNKRNE